METIKVIVIINMLLILYSQMTQTKSLLLKKVTKNQFMPKGYLQKLPLNLSAIIFLLSIVALFDIFKYETPDNLMNIRVTGLIAYVIFSWMQLSAIKNLREFYSQDVVILKNHKLITTGIHKYIRHPQYLFAAISDIGIAFALMNYVLLPLAAIQLILFILRAKFEEDTLENHFKGTYTEYKEKTKFMIPFIW